MSHKKNNLPRLGKIFQGILMCSAVMMLGFQGGNQDRDDLETLLKLFKDPPREYRPAPLWVWNTKVTRSMIDSQLVDFKKKHFGGVMVHPRPGLVTEYLSREWFDLFEHTVRRGRELGLNVWIYDENSYPTGFAGGHVPDQMPESYNQGQMLRMAKSDVFPGDPQSYFIIVKLDGGKFIDVTSRASEEKGRSGTYYLFQKAFYNKQASMVGPPDFPYVDLMVKGVTEKFIDVTFKAYEKATGREFGKTVVGVFSDEPSIPAQGPGNIRWTPDLFVVFKERWGYDLATNLPSLFEETGDWKKVRHNYMTSLSQLFIDRWSKPMFAYTERHKLKWTGHYWEHGWPNPNDVPDNMAMYAWHQYPGIDMLFNQFDEQSPNAQFGNIRAVKELASVANQLDKKRTLSETYGGGGWELTFRDMKRLGDWQFALGVNFLNQHLSFMSINGARKYDYPQSFSYHNPNWPYYGTLNQYFARLSLALSRGRQRNSILIIEPTTSAWMYFSRLKKNARFNEIGSDFQSFVTRLEKAQVEYDLGSENIIKDQGKILNGKFVVGQGTYTTVVIPPGMENIDLPTFRLLKSYIASGGKVIGFSNLRNLDGKVNMEVGSYAKKKANVIQLAALDDKVIMTHFSSAGFRVLKEAKDSSGNLYHHRRQLKDGQVVFFSNASLSSPSIGRAIIKGRDALVLDLLTGELMDYPEKVQNGNVVVDFNIPPAGSLLFFIADKKKAGIRKFTPPMKVTEVIATPVKVLRPSENTLLIDFCDLQLKDTLLKEAHVSAASRAAFTKNGFNRNPWDHQMQFKKRILERDNFSRESGFTASYHFNIDGPVGFERFRAVVEQGPLWTSIRINGNSVRPVGNEWWLDKSFSIIEIGKYLQEGENTLSVSIDPMSIYAEIEPVYILGNFNLEPAKKGWHLVPPQPLSLGSWNKQGMPMYGQGITYRKELSLNAGNGKYLVQLGNWMGTVAVVRVNGTKVGIITGEPNYLAIDRYLKVGTNAIEIEVIGSLKNLLGPHHNSPRPGMVGPGQWNVKSYPPGEKYETIGYGLMEDFRIFKYK